MSVPDAAWRDHHPFLRHILNLLTAYISPANLLAVAVVASSYALTGACCLALLNPDPGATLLWLPAGVSVAAVMLRGATVWPGIFLGAAALDAIVGVRVITSLGVAGVATLEALAGGWLARRFCGGKAAFVRPRDTLAFLVLTGAAMPATCAALGAGVLRLEGVPDVWRVFRIWWTGDLLGVVLLCPFLVMLLGQKHHPLRAREMVEMTAVLLALALVCVLNFGPPAIPWVPRSGLHYLCVPLLAWIAVRFCALEASGAALLVGGITMWGSAHGHGLFGMARELSFVGAGYIATVAATTLTLASVFTEYKQQLEDALRARYAPRRQRAAEAGEGAGIDATCRLEASSPGS